MELKHFKNLEKHANRNFPILVKSNLQYTSSRSIEYMYTAFGNNLFVGTSLKHGPADPSSTLIPIFPGSLTSA